MIAELSFTIETSTIDHAKNLRDQVVSRLNADPNTTVVSSSGQAFTAIFQVLGADTNTREKFVEEVEARDEQDAEAQVKSPTRIPVMTRRKP